MMNLFMGSIILSVLAGAGAAQPPCGADDASCKMSQGGDALLQQRTSTVEKHKFAESESTEDAKPSTAPAAAGPEKDVKSSSAPATAGPGANQSGGNGLIQRQMGYPQPMNECEVIFFHKAQCKGTGQYGNINYGASAIVTANSHEYKRIVLTQSEHKRWKIGRSLEEDQKQWITSTIVNDDYGKDDTIYSVYVSPHCEEVELYDEDSGGVRGYEDNVIIRPIAGNRVGSSQGNKAFATLDVAVHSEWLGDLKGDYVTYGKGDDDDMLNNRMACVTLPDDLVHDVNGLYVTYTPNAVDKPKS